MKMVAAAKYARAERALKPARVYGTGAMGMQFIIHKSSLLCSNILKFNLNVLGYLFFSYLCCLALYEKAEIKAPEDKNKHLIIGVSSDRGLCGAIHSSVAKAMKSEIAKLTGAGKEVMVVNVGDKLRGLLYRYLSLLPL